MCGAWLMWRRVGSVVVCSVIVIGSYMMAGELQRGELGVEGLWVEKLSLKYQRKLLKEEMHGLAAGGVFRWSSSTGELVPALSW